MMRLCEIALVACSVGIAGCGSDPVAGNSVETENTASARILPVDSILPTWNRPAGGTVATLRFDRSDFDFAASFGDGRDLQFTRLGGAALPFFIDVWDSAAGRGRVLVRIDDSLLLADSSRIRMVWGVRQTSLSDAFATWVGLSDSTGLLANSALVDDFQDSNTTNSLPVANTWYASAYGSSSNVSGISFDTAGLSRSGQALHVTYTAPTTTSTTQYVVVATYLGSKPDCLRSLDSLVFWARGSGTLYVALEHLTNSAGPKAWMHFTLDSTAWTRKSVRPSDFDAADGEGNNYGWNVVRDSITTLTFLVKGGSNLWLDDIRLHGVNRDDLK